MTVFTTNGLTDITGLITSLTPAFRYRLLDGGLTRVVACSASGSNGEYSETGVRFHQSVVLDANSDGVIFDGVAGSARLPGFDAIGQIADGCWIGTFNTDPAADRPPYTLLGPQTFDRVAFAIGDLFKVLIPANTNLVRVSIDGTDLDTEESVSLYGSTSAWTVMVSVVSGTATVYVNGVSIGTAPWSFDEAEAWAGRDVPVGAGPEAQPITYASFGVSELVWMNGVASATTLAFVTTGSPTIQSTGDNIANFSAEGPTDSGKGFATDEEAAAGTNPSKIPNVAQVAAMVAAGGAGTGRGIVGDQVVVALEANTDLTVNFPHLTSLIDVRVMVSGVPADVSTAITGSAQARVNSGIDIPTAVVIGYGYITVPTSP